MVPEARSPLAFVGWLSDSGIPLVPSSVPDASQMWFGLIAGRGIILVLV